MVEAVEISEKAHQLCLENLDGKVGHDVTAHAQISQMYANAVNEEGLDATAEDVVAAIMIASSWFDVKDTWPGHPTPESVNTVLKSGGK
jgi:hypothetical protein